MDRFTPIVMRSSVLTDTTPLSAGGFFTSVNRMRPTGDQPDKRVMESFGGWQKALTTLLNGKARGCFTFKDKNSLTTNAVGTHLQIYSWRDNQLKDITPFTSYDNSKSDILTTTAGSKELRFLWGVHSFAVNDRLQLRNDVTVGETAISAFTDFTVNSIATSSFTVSLDISAVATSSAAGGDLKIGIYLAGGREYSVAGPGWGTGAWSRGTWGGSDTATIYEARTHTFARWGLKNLQVLPSRNTLFEWDAIFTTPSELVSGTWTEGSGFSASGATVLDLVSSATSSDATLSIDLVTGAFHRFEFDLSLSAGAIDALVGTTTIAASLDTTGLYTYEFYAVTGDLTFTKSATAVGQISGISVKQMERLAAVPNAPSEMNVMCVTAENITMVGGAPDPVTGIYTPMLLRWSDQFGNVESTVPANQVWTAAATNQAGARLLNKGGRIVAILPAANETLIWTDKALYRAVYVPDPRIVYRVTEVAENCGIMSSRAMAVLEGVVYWMSPSGQVYMYSGGQPVEMPCTLKDDVYNNMAFIQQALIHASTTVKKGEVLFFYSRRTIGSEINSYFAVTKYGESFGGTMARLCRQDAGIEQYPWAVDENGQVYFHEIGNAGDNAAIGESFNTGLIGIGSGETLMEVDRFLYDFANMVGAFELRVKTYKWANDQNPTTYGPYNVTPTTTKIDLGPILPTGRYISFHGQAVGYPTYIRFGTPLVSSSDTGMFE